MILRKWRLTQRHGKFCRITFLSNGHRAVRQFVTYLVFGRTKLNTLLAKRAGCVCLRCRYPSDRAMTSRSGRGQMLTASLCAFQKRVMRITPGLQISSQLPIPQITMSSESGGIYTDPTFRDTDIGEIMRHGHPDVADGDRHILSVIHRIRDRLGRPLRILDVGAGSGHLSLMIARELGDSVVIANEIADEPARQARAKMAACANARIFDRSFGEWRDKVDVIVSWGTHHHLGHDYLRHVRDVLAVDGLLIIGDEFSPEYLTPSDQKRLDGAQEIEIVDGYIFDNKADLNAYRQTRVVPQWSLQLEQARRRALWTWYRFVGDYAVSKDDWGVLITELQIARDDFITSFSGEQKTSPYLLERELNLNGFSVIERVAIGNREPELQSFIIYTCQVVR
jgi:SAM-dependent methyltransferase